jgi:hypothetical protein
MFKKKGLVSIRQRYTGLLPVINQTMRIIMPITSRTCIMNPTAGSKIQPKSQIKITMRAIQRRIDIFKT